MYSHLPKKILILPSGFKESLGAIQVAQAIKKGVQRVLVQSQVVAIPVADGGEDTARILANVTQGRLIDAIVTGPLGQKVGAHFALLGGHLQTTAVVEIASSAGLKLIPFDQRNPMYTTSYGVGELILHAINYGAKHIIIGCGDSGICDGGLGLLQALGAKIYNARDIEVGLGGEQLSQVHRIDFSTLASAILNGEVKFTLALNPFNVLTGEQGVAKVFGPQKGATDAQVEILSQGLNHWADRLAEVAINQQESIDFKLGAGTGASGGLGVAFAALGARLRSRFDVLLDPTLFGFDLNEEIQQADLIITAEGAIDFQTPKGKVPAEVCRRANLYHKPVIALAGSIGEGADELYNMGIGAMSSIVNVPMPLEQAMLCSERLLVDATDRVMRTLVLGANMARYKIG